MISRNAVRTRRARVPGAQPWTEQALFMQMNVLSAVLQQSPDLNVTYLSHQCLLTSKILDSLVANNRMPVWRQELLPVIKQICKHRDSPDVRPALLVLLFSVKNAFRTEWLASGQVTERDEIFTTLKLLYDSLTTGHEVSGNDSVQLLRAGGSAAKDVQEARAYLTFISSRFYPRLQLINVFVAVQAKVGYEVLMCDFHVPHMDTQDRVRLYVGQKDVTETSTCIITPPQVNILVNGQQVEKRVTTGYLDAGPQMPSDVTTMVKVGSNVLQVIGEFSVSYIIAVTSSRTIERSERTTELEDYVAPIKAASEVDPAEVDDEVVEGASRVSLRCPISHQRLGTPVKATTCRHLQCFDYDSFLEINEKRPAWRCPCCNRFISCPDLRIDRQMEKVLKETDEKIHEVIFYQDGSWVPASTSGDEGDIITDASIIGGSELGSKVIDLSDIDEEEPQQQERKPDAQTLQAIIGNRGVSSQPTNPVVQQQDTVVGYPVISVPEFTTVAPQSSPSFAGPSWAGGTFVNVNGGVLYTSTSGTVEMQSPNQPAPSVQSLSAINHNFQVTFPQSRTAAQLSSPAGAVNWSAPNRGYLPSAQLQQPQTGASLNTGNQGETRWVRQRQVEQQSSGISQNVQDLGQARPQWRSTGVTLQQLGTNAAQPQNAQQFYSNQSPVSNSPRQQHARPGVNSRQHPSPGRSAQVRQHPSAGVNTQQRPGNWGGAHTGQWRSSSSPNQSQVPGSAGASEQNWRPTGRMRGSVTIQGHGVQGQRPSASQQRVPVASSVNTVPSIHSHGFNTAPTNAGNRPMAFSQYEMGMPVLNNLTANVSLYNGTTWVNGADLSSAPLIFTGVHTADGWLGFENVNSGTPTGQPY